MSFIFRQAPLSSTSESFKITSSLFLSRATLCWSKAWGRWLIVCRHLEFDGQLKLALHQPRFSGTQRIAIKFRNFVNFYDLNLSSVQSEISLKHIRTLRITRWVNWLGNNMFIGSSSTPILENQPWMISISAWTGARRDWTTTQVRSCAGSLGSSRRELGRWTTTQGLL